MSNRALNSADIWIFGRILDMVYELKGRKNICTFGNVITLQRNITKKQIWEKAACSKLQSYLK